MSEWGVTGQTNETQPGQSDKVSGQVLSSTGCAVHSLGVQTSCPHKLLPVLSVS